MDRLGIFEYGNLANQILADDRKGLVMLARTKSSLYLADYHIIISNDSIIIMQQILNLPASLISTLCRSDLNPPLLSPPSHRNASQERAW